MKNSIKNTLVGIVGAGAITLAALGLTGCASPKNDIYSKIDSHSSCPSKECDELKNMYKSIDLENLSEKEIEILKLDKSQRKKLVNDFQSYYESNFVNPDRASDKDLIFIYRWAEQINEDYR